MSDLRGDQPRRTGRCRMSPRPRLAADCIVVLPTAVLPTAVVPTDSLATDVLLDFIALLVALLVTVFLLSAVALLAIVTHSGGPSRRRCKATASGKHRKSVSGPHHQGEQDASHSGRGHFDFSHSMSTK